jgi:hypothetical protein
VAQSTNRRRIGNFSLWLNYIIGIRTQYGANNSLLLKYLIVLQMFEASLLGACRE